MGVGVEILSGLVGYVQVFLKFPFQPSFPIVFSQCLGIHTGSGSVAVYSPKGGSGTSSAVYVSVRPGGAGMSVELVAVLGDRSCVVGLGGGLTTAESWVSLLWVLSSFLLPWSCLFFPAGFWCLLAWCFSCESCLLPGSGASHGCFGLSSCEFGSVGRSWSRFPPFVGSSF